MTDDQESLRRMVLGFRLSELQHLMSFVGKSKAGRMEDLQREALHLVRSNSRPINIKIKELYSYVPARSATFFPGPSYISIKPESNRFPASSPIASTSSSWRPLRNAAPPASSYGNNPRPLRNAVNPCSNGNCDLLYTFRYTSVRFKQIPFYEVLAELLQPVVTIPGMSFPFLDVKYRFDLTPRQAIEIQNSRCSQGKQFQTQVLLRCCLADTSREQCDEFPNNVLVKVNGKPCLLPKAAIPGIGPSLRQAIDITSLLNLTPLQSFPVLNHFAVNWDTIDMMKYAMAVYVVRKLTAEQLVHKLKSKGIRQLDHTKYMNHAGSGIAAINLRVSLLCPLSKGRMEFPCRAVNCKHLQCFDALSFIRMNLRNPTWKCPVCNRSAPYEALYGDGLFTHILERAEKDCTEVLFLEDGRWELTTQASNDGFVIVDCETEPASKVIEVIDISDD